jgi:hypothetical protein
MATQFEDFPHDNPIFADRGLILRSTCGEQQQRPEQPKRTAVPPIIGEIVANLGLRYRPSGKVDLEAHAEALILLGQDCADMPPPLLDAAAKRWARESKFMPKASELRETALAIQAEAVRGTDVGAEQMRAHCDKLNAMSWVRQSRKPFIISQRQVDGQTIRFVDRAA